MVSTFRVCCGHCHAIVLASVGVLDDEASVSLSEHLRAHHPAILPPERVALGDLLRHFDFNAETEP